MGRVAGRLIWGAAAGLLVAHASPALTAIGPLRNRFTPGLSGVGRPDHVALTFDDGPDPASTPYFLDLLDELGVHATFFLLARTLVRDPWLGGAIVRGGHEVAVHGYDHRCLLARGHRATHAHLARARDLIAEHTGQRPRWYRPPYGVLSGSGLHAARALGLTPVLWTRWGRDWSARATPDSVFDLVAPGLTGGATILLHDSDCTSAPGAWRSTLGALPRIIDRVRTLGLRPGPLRDHRPDRP